MDQEREGRCAAGAWGTGSTALVEVQYKFILHHQVMYGQTDEKVTVELIQEKRAIHKSEIHLQRKSAVEYEKKCCTDDVFWPRLVNFWTFRSDTMYKIQEIQATREGVRSAVPEASAIHREYHR
jgi:hypothetical protein